ncbi:hypothetical protein CSB37_02425 [bacterium DOLZORAL124_38_8]|nr:MAG: hypothetical protein CSB37_02425 [bacterium DOLZORAL124_38_8]
MKRNTNFKTMENTKKQTPVATPSTPPTPKVELNIPTTPPTNSKKDSVPPASSIAESFQNYTPDSLLTILKNVTKSALIITAILQGWLIMDLNPQNEYLSKISLENTGKTYADKKEKVQELESEKLNLTQKINKIKTQIEKNEFSKFHEEIKNIRAQHINWFDSKENNQLKIGLFDAADKVKLYFKKHGFKDNQNLISDGNEIKIKDQSITRENATITIEAAQTYKRLFYLANELTKQMNAYPFFKNGTLSEFSRNTDQSTGLDSMEFTINLDRQTETEKDPADIRFAPLKKWLSN